ncbi:MAG TPA: outer membrane protein assembly factor BamA, partial [Nitrospirota bacterium]
ARLEIMINEHAPTRVKDVLITGTPTLPVENLLKKLSVKKGKILRRENLDDSVSALSEFFLARDFVKVEVDEPVIEYKDELATVTFKIVSGPKLEVNFTGNGSISSRKLKKVLTFWEDKDLSDENISENLDKLSEYYQNEGYFFASVTSRTEESLDPPVASVTFLVKEGPKVKLDKVELDGNREVTDKELLAIMELNEKPIFGSRKVTTGAIERDIDRIKTFYQTKGFLKTEVSARDISFSKDSRHAVVAIDIIEGPKTLVSEVGITGNKALQTKDIMAVLKENKGSPADPQQQKEDQDAVLNLYSQHGFIRATIDTEREFSEDGKSVKLVYKINEGMKLTVGRIVIRGLEDTKSIVIRRELLVAAGDPLDYEKLLRSQQKIYKLGFFSQVRIQPVEPEKVEPVKDLVVNLREKNAGAVEFGLGYGDYDGVRGFGEVSYRNLFGMGHRISARSDVSQRETKYLVSYRWPWFLGRKLDFHASLVTLDSQKPNYHINDKISLVGLDKTFGEHITTTFAYQFERIKFGNVRSGAVLAPEDRKKANIGSLSPSAIIDYRDNPFNPTRGSVQAVILKYASKYLGSTVDFVKLTAQSSHYFPVYKGIVLGVSGRGGIVGYTKQKFEIPISERFFLGGASSLRGFKFENVSPRGRDNSLLGGDSMLLVNTELRFPLPYDFGLVTFLDAGNAWLLNKEVSVANFKQTGSSGLRYGAGVGLRYNTPVGPIRLDYGFNLNPLPGESRAVLHFTIGQAF